jgi:hypothetical protein
VPDCFLVLQFEITCLLLHLVQFCVLDYVRILVAIESLEKLFALIAHFLQACGKLLF